jgi:hypothetical protein
VTRWADVLVIAQKPSAALASQIEESGLPVVDLVGYLTVQSALSGVA